MTESQSALVQLLVDTDFWKAVASMLWPVVVIVIFFSLREKLYGLFNRDNLTIKVAGMEISVADATKNIGSSVADLQKRLAALEAKTGNAPMTPENANIVAAGRNLSASLPETAPARPQDQHFSILWVDDNPSNNAFLVEQFQNDGVEVQLALSTADGMARFQSSHFNLVITDLGRTEHGIDNKFAGLDLIKKIRVLDRNVPILVYAGLRGYQNRDQLITAGATDVFHSTVDLVGTIHDIRSKPL